MSTLVIPNDRASLAAEAASLGQIGSTRGYTADEQHRAKEILSAINGREADAEERRYHRAFNNYLHQLNISDDDLSILEERRWQLLSDPDRKILAERRKQLRPGEKRDMATGDGSFPQSLSGYFAPVQFVADVYRMLKQEDQLFDENVVTRIETPRGGPASVPSCDDTAAAATKVTQGAPDSALDPGIGTLSFPTCSTWRTPQIKAGIELERDSGIPLEPFLTRSFGIRFARGIGADNLKTLLASATQGAVATGSASNTGGSETGATSIGTDDLFSLVRSVNSAYAASDKAAWVMSYDTLLSLQALKDRQGRLILPTVHDAAGNFLLLEKPVRICPSMPAIGSGNKPILFGDLSRLIVRSVENSLRVHRSWERFIEQGALAYQAFWRADALLQVTPGADSPVKYLVNA